MRRPDYDFVRKTLRGLDRPDTGWQSLAKKMVLKSLHAPIISLWGKHFEQTEPGLFERVMNAEFGWKERGDLPYEEWFESKTKWLYDDFVFLAEDYWKDHADVRKGPVRKWVYFVKGSNEDHPLSTELEEDAFSCNFIQRMLADSDTPEDRIFDLDSRDFYYGLCVVSFLDKGEWTDPAILGTYCFWIPDLDHPIYTPSEKEEIIAFQGDLGDLRPRWYYFPTKSTEDFYIHNSIPEVSQKEGGDCTAKTLTEVGSMHRYLKYGNRHAVEVLLNPKKLAKSKSNLANRDRPWNTASGPHVLLLDRMPATQKEGTGTHASPKPHRRRGYWRTLSHPRYRHHPQYQQKIYVKPSFVGPRQTTYEGNIYRLVQPLEEKLL